MTLSEEVAQALARKQDLIMQGAPLIQDGQPGDLRTNVFAKDKTLLAMKGSKEGWRYSMPFTEQIPTFGIDDYLLQHIARSTYAHRDIYNGTFRETFNALVTSDGSIVTCTVTEASSASTLTMQFSDGDTSLDTASITIALTAGSDASPTDNFVYILQSDKILTVSTSDWPSTEHIRIAYFFVPSAGFVQTNGVYVNQNWNDHDAGADNQGHLAHITDRQRRMSASYFSGVDGNGTDGYLTPTAGNVELIATSGVVYQVHKHSVSAFDTSGTDQVLVKNWNGDAFHDITNLYDIVDDSGGNTIGNNKWFNLVIWGVVNKSGEYTPMMVNLPSGFYNTQSGAEADSSGFDDFTLPAAFNHESSTAFLVARITIQMKTGGGTWVVGSTFDLRGGTPFSASGGASSPEVEFADNAFAIFDESDNTKIAMFDVGTNVSTATTRTLKVPDASDNIALSGGGIYAIEGLATGRNVLRSIRLRLEPGATPGTNIDITDQTSAGTQGFNGPTITDATDLAKSGSSGSFALDASGVQILLDITEDIIGVISSSIIFHKINSASTSEMYTVLTQISSARLDIRLIKRGATSSIDLTTIMDASDLCDILIGFVTSS